LGRASNEAEIFHFIPAQLRSSLPVDLPTVALVLVLVGWRGCRFFFLVQFKGLQVQFSLSFQISWCEVSIIDSVGGNFQEISCYLPNPKLSPLEVLIETSP